MRVTNKIYEKSEYASRHNHNNNSNNHHDDDEDEQKSCERTYNVWSLCEWVSEYAHKGRTAYSVHLSLGLFIAYAYAHDIDHK